MERFSMLVGIGMMLVGALAYALPETQDFRALLPALAGIVIATGGIVARMDEDARRKFLQVNAVAAVLLVIFVLTRLGHDLAQFRSHQLAAIADFDVLGLAIIFVITGLRNRLRSKKIPTQSAS